VIRSRGMAAPIVQAVADALAAEGVDVAALGLAWARATPAVAIVPALGLRALPGPARAAIALGLAASVYPAFAGAIAPAIGGGAAPWPLLALGEIVAGVPVAIAAAIPLWAATMAGGVVDALRGAQDGASFVAVEGRATPLGVLFSLLASCLFFASGGPSRVALALAARDLPAHPIARAAHDIAGGVSVAIAIGAPLLAAAIVLEVAAALVARAATPAQVQAVVAPWKALGLLAIAGVVLDRIAAVLAAATPLAR